MQGLLLNVVRHQIVLKNMNGSSNNVRFSKQRPVTEPLWSRTILSKLPNEPNASSEPSLKLSPRHRRALHNCSCHKVHVSQVQLKGPEYESRLEMLPAYRASLDARYPPICENCMPLVEDEIRRKEHMARVQALGGWLSKGKERQRQVSDEIQNPVKVVNERMLFWWRLRGCLWAFSTAFSITGNISGNLFTFFHEWTPNTFQQCSNFNFTAISHFSNPHYHLSLWSPYFGQHGIPRTRSYSMLNNKADTFESKENMCIE